MRSRITISATPIHLHSFCTHEDLLMRGRGCSGTPFEVHQRCSGASLRGQCHSWSSFQIAMQPVAAGASHGRDPATHRTTRNGHTRLAGSSLPAAAVSQLHGTQCGDGYGQVAGKSAQTPIIFAHWRERGARVRGLSDAARMGCVNCGLSRWRHGMLSKQGP